MFRLKKNLKVLTNWHANNVNKYSIWNNLLLIYNYRYFEFSRRFWKVRNRTAIITRLYISNNFQSIFTKLYRIIRFIYFREKKIISVILNGMYFFFSFLFKHMRMLNFKQEIYKYTKYFRILQILFKMLCLSSLYKNEVPLHCQIFSPCSYATCYINFYNE